MAARWRRGYGCPRHRSHEGSGICRQDRRRQIICPRLRILNNQDPPGGCREGLLFFTDAFFRNQGRSSGVLCLKRTWSSVPGFNLVLVLTVAHKKLCSPRTGCYHCLWFLVAVARIRAKGRSHGWLQVHVQYAVKESLSCSSRFPFFFFLLAFLWGGARYREEGMMLPGPNPPYAPLPGHLFRHCLPIRMRWAMTGFFALPTKCWRFVALRALLRTSRVPMPLSMPISRW